MTSLTLYRLFVRGTGGREREVPVPEAVQAALEAWFEVHPLARGVGLRDEDPLFIRLGRHAHEDPVGPSPEAVYRLVHCHAPAAGDPQTVVSRILTRCGPTGQADASKPGVPVHEVPARLGHVDLRTTARYAVARPKWVDDIADVLDRRHQVSRHSGTGISPGD